MRPPARPQSAHRYPLNAILGTEASVRLLRVLVAAEGEAVSAGELARRAALARTSIYQPLDQLERTGLVTYGGAGRQRQVSFRGAHPLAPAIEALFAAEAAAFARLLDALRDAAASFPDATAVWLEGPIAGGTDTLGEPLSCFVLATPDRLPVLTSGLRDAFAPIERSHDVTILVHGITRSELATRADDSVPALLEAILLAGTPPAAFHPTARERLKRQRRIAEHGDHDAYALATAGLLSNLVTQDPGVIGRALREVERRMERASPGERHELEEWAHLLSTTTPRRFRDLLVHPGERMTRLRQTMPFVSLLAPEDRARLTAPAFDDAGE
jgi:DNA-binding transcriptional ArsR family regulator